jgi:hypothetical protein
MTRRYSISLADELPLSLSFGVDIIKSKSPDAVVPSWEEVRDAKSSNGFCQYDLEGGPNSENVLYECLVLWVIDLPRIVSSSARCQEWRCC